MRNAKNTQTSTGRRINSYSNSSVLLSRRKIRYKSPFDIKYSKAVSFLHDLEENEVKRMLASSEKVSDRG